MSNDMSRVYSMNLSIFKCALNKKKIQHAIAQNEWLPFLVFLPVFHPPPFPGLHAKPQTIPTSPKLTTKRIAHWIT
jgi:hypothetical protein